MLKWIMKRWITKHYGSECGAYAKGCPLCFAWLSWHYLFDEDDDENLKWDGKKGEWYLEPLEEGWEWEEVEFKNIKPNPNAFNELFELIDSIPCKFKSIEDFEHWMETGELINKEESA